MTDHIQPHPLAFQDQPEWLRVTLSCIGEGVITTDNQGIVTFLNPVAEQLIAWTQGEAVGMPLSTVFQIVNEQTRLAAENPAFRSLREGVIVGLANHTLLIAKDGTERPIDDSAAPIRNASGEIAGVVLVFRDVTDRKQAEQLASEAQAYADNIIATMREPFLVLDSHLKVVTANQSFYDAFEVTLHQTQGQFVYDLGNRQWDIPQLRKLLEEVLPQEHDIQDFEVTHDFPVLGRKVMRLNARRIRRPGNHSELILLAIKDITSQRESEEILRQSEAKFRSLLESAPDAMVIVNQQGTIVLVNALTETLFGYSRAELIGQTMEVLIPERFRERHVTQREGYFQRPHARVMGIGLALSGLHRDGHEIPVEVSLSPLQSEQGMLVSSSIRDITGRLQSERSLLQSEKRLRFILDSMPQKIGTTTPDGDVTYFNPQWSAYTGLTLDQLAGRGWKRVVHPDDAEEHVRLWRLSIQTSDPFEFESRLRRFDGEYRWHVSRAIPMRDDAGQITMWIGSNTDIHDIRQAEETMHVSENRYRRLFEAAKDGILILDSGNGKIVDANPFMCGLLGYTHEEFLGKEMWEIGLFRDKSANEAAVRGLQMSGYLRYEHMPLETVAGRQVEVEIVANVYREDQETVIQCNIRDITERSRLEELLRTQSVEMSDLHRRKDEFLAMLSHELRSPLAPIANAVQLLSLQTESETLIHKKARIIIERQLGQLHHLVDDLLEVSRITTGRVQLRKERVAMCNVVRGAIETARPLIDQRRHHLNVSLPAEPIWLDADPARLEQVVVNLLTNAAKYTEEGGRIDLSLQCVGPECELRVRDNGVGISPTLLPRIFDLFTQAERSLDRSDGGLGIGLALVQRLTELHDGTVEVRSVLGHGSEFIVCLPIPSAEQRGADGNLDGSHSADQSVDASPLRVLVVDDNVDTVLSFAMLLQASGHDVRTAHDGLEAIQIAFDYRPDVMILDIGLPGLNGYEVAKRIREQPLLQDVVLVALTGYGQDSDRATSLQAGFNHHMVKPASFAQIKQILSTVPKLPR